MPTMSQEQRCVIVENDPIAQEAIRKLWSDADAGVISRDRAGRLFANIEGNAIQRWREACKSRGLPLSAGLPLSSRVRYLPHPPTKAKPIQSLAVA